MSCLVITWLLVTRRNRYFPVRRRSNSRSWTSLKFAAISPDQTRSPSMEYSSTVETEELARESFKRKEETNGLGKVSKVISETGSIERPIARDDGCRKPWRITYLPAELVPVTTDD